MRTLAWSLTCRKHMIRHFQSQTSRTSDTVFNAKFAKPKMRTRIVKLPTGQMMRVAIRFLSQRARGVSRSASAGIGTASINISTSSSTSTSHSIRIGATSPSTSTSARANVCISITFGATIIATITTTKSNTNIFTSTTSIGITYATIIVRCAAGFL